MTTPPTLRRRLTAFVATSTLALAVTASAGAVPIDPARSGASAAAWIAAQQADDGSVDHGFSGPVGNTIQAALALAVAGEQPAAFEAAAAYVAANHPDYVFDAQDTPQPGALGYTALLAVAAGDDPTSYGEAGTDLVGQIQSTEQAEGDDAGQYGEGTVFDRVFSHGLAMLGLAAAGATPSQAAIDWLEEQQCPDGGWPSYRSPGQRAAGTCERVEGEGDPSTFPPPMSTTPDTNSTAVAVQALVAAEAGLGGNLVLPEPTYDAEQALAYIAGAQNDDGGWAFSPGFDTDANSTGLIVQAINALGDDATAQRWIDENRDGPFTALRSLQFGCEAPAGDRGAFWFPPFDDSPPSPDGGSTYGGAWGMGQDPFPSAQASFERPDQAPLCPEIITDREAGDDRFETAALLARDVYAGGVDTIVLASGVSYADALAGAPLAAQLDAPVLLTAPDELPGIVAATVNDLGATQAVILGGVAAVSQAVEDALVAQTSVTAEGVDRIAGENRFDTAAMIAQRVGGDDVYVVQGIDSDPNRGWPDALAVAPLAAFQGRAVLLTATDELPSQTSDALAGKASATVVGGPAAISDDVEAAIDEQVEAVSRVFGETRYGTALALSRLARDVGMDASDVWIATGTAFPDGLAAGPVVAKYGAVLFLVPDDLSSSEAAGRFLHEVNTTLGELSIVGGTHAVPTSTVRQLLDAAR
ncbi:MAG TPA: cell wall-binding repeat-containing protein [Nitriliruptorales bacterium]